MKVLPKSVHLNGAAMASHPQTSAVKTISHSALFSLSFHRGSHKITNFLFPRYDSKYRETQQRMEELGLMEHSPVLRLDEWEIPRESIVLNRKLGEGAFGAVCGGEVIGIGGDGEWVPVAVKSLKIGSLPEDKVCSLLFSAVKRDTFAKAKLP